MSASALRVRAPAKVNLALKVLGKRPDGFHEVDTLLMAFGLADVLAATPVSAGLSLEVGGPMLAGVPADDSNLVLRAACALQELARARGADPGGVHFALEKNVPPAAGLGGGSSDAAAAALACAHLWDLDPDLPEVLEILARLGSDCAFFMRARESGLARCSGRGERVEPLPAMAVPHALVVLTPTFGCETAAVYRALDGGHEHVEREAVTSFELASASAGGARLLQASVVNQLERAARHAYPRLEAFAEVLEDCAPGAFRLAGSGSSWFGFQPDEAAGRALLGRVEVTLRARRYALRGGWVLPARSQGMGLLSSKSQ